MNNDLMNKLVVAKKIMDVHNKTPRGNASGLPSYDSPMVENYNAPSATYNIPQEFLSEAPQQQTQTSSSTIPQVPTRDKILNSKLPDEIKRLMMEHPIDQPNTMSGPTLSNELIEAASRLMKTNNTTSPQPQQQTQTTSQSFGNIDMNMLKKMMKETITEVLTEKGMIAESSQKTKEQISFKVGQHVFEGFVTKIKKMKY